MPTKTHSMPTMTSAYELLPLEEFALRSPTAVRTGFAHIGAGTRSPSEGLRASATYEIAYVISGKACIETVQRTLIIQAGDAIISAPAELHATTAIEETIIFYVLLDELGAGE